MRPEPVEVAGGGGGVKRKAEVELEVVTADDLGVATVEVIDGDDTNKSSRAKVTTCTKFYSLLNLYVVFEFRLK